MTKIAISLPDEQADAVEAIRRDERVPRSRVIQDAIALYLRHRAERRATREYEDGYRRMPEGGAAEGYTQASADMLAAEDWG
jgi:metal-responsive CopG/Arc/MetJ family transcriptional regulator